MDVDTMKDKWTREEIIFIASIIKTKKYLVLDTSSTFVDYFAQF